LPEILVEIESGLTERRVELELLDAPL